MRDSQQCKLHLNPQMFMKKLNIKHVGLPSGLKKKKCQQIKPKILVQQKLKRLIMCFKCFPYRGHHTAGNPRIQICVLLLSKGFIFSE